MITINNTYQDEHEDNSRSLKDFILGAKIQLETRVKNLLEPRFDPAQQDSFLKGVKQSFQSLQMTPYPAQLDAILALAKGYKEGKKALALVAEMGCGKTLLSIFTAYAYGLIARRPTRTLIVCPPTLVTTWRDELKKIHGNNNLKIIDANGQNALSLLVKARDEAKINGRRPKINEFWIVGLNRMKLSCGWKPAWAIRKVYEKNEGNKGYLIDEQPYCPQCSYVFEEHEITTKRRCRCPECGNPLWGPNPRHKRWAPVNYIKRQTGRNFFDFLIADEVHLMKGASSIQVAVLAGC